jgi:AcrR family transcriptional regulator
MPKIIENLENKLILEAIKQIQEQGYGAVTIRSVANACNVGVGTVYNYFQSKNDLLAAYMVQDWNRCMDAVNTVDSDVKEVLLCMYTQIRSFMARYKDIFQDPEAKEGYSYSYSRYHKILRAQMAEPIRKFCESDFTADFIAESFFTWTFAGKTFEELYGIISKLL